MDLLFKREQTAGKWRSVVFRMWGKVELSAEEQALIKKYRMHDAVLIEGLNAGLLRKTAWRAGGVFVLTALVTTPFGMGAGIILGLLAAVGFAYWFINEQRETIFVKDLIHGRWFNCDSVVDLAQKEAWLEQICGTFRQVLEAAKHWDGTERHTIEPLPKEEVRAFFRSELKQAA